MNIFLPVLIDDELKLISKRYHFLFFDGIKVLVYSIYLNDTIIGSFDIYTEHRDLHQVEIGYTIYKDYRNRGYATRCIRIVCEMLEREYHTQKIYAKCYKTNTISIKILKKNGFVPISETHSIVTLEKPSS